MTRSLGLSVPPHPLRRREELESEFLTLYTSSWVNMSTRGEGAELWLHGNGSSCSQAPSRSHPRNGSSAHSSVSSLISLRVNLFPGVLWPILAHGGGGCETCSHLACDRHLQGSTAALSPYTERSVLIPGSQGENWIGLQDTQLVLQNCLVGESLHTSGTSSKALEVIGSCEKSEEKLVFPYIPGLLPFRRNFRIILSTSTKQYAGTETGIVLNL